jgi:hypothetical protein
LGVLNSLTNWPASSRTSETLKVANRTVLGGDVASASSVKLFITVINKVRRTRCIVASPGFVIVRRALPGGRNAILAVRQPWFDG